MSYIFRTGRPTNFKIGTQTEHEDPHQLQKAQWPPRSKFKVTRSRTPLTSVDRVVDNLPTNFGLPRTFSTYRPTPVRRTWPGDLDLWSWRSRRLSLMRVFVLRLYTMC